MRKMKTLISIFLITMGFAAAAQVYNRPLKEGNELYGEEKYDEAEIRYREAIDEEEEENDAVLRGEFNLGDALYKQDRFEEAAEQFSKVIAMSENESVKAQAYHNLGNTFYQQKMLEEAAAAYKSAMKLDPQDDQTRYNLAKTIRELKKQQQQQKQQQDQMEPSEYAKKLKKQAEALAKQFQFSAAYALMQEGLQKDETVAYYKDFIKKLGDVVQIAE